MQRLKDGNKLGEFKDQKSRPVQLVNEGGGSGLQGQGRRGVDKRLTVGFRGPMDMDEGKCPLSFHQSLTENRHFFQSRMLTAHSNVSRAGHLSTETTDPSTSPLLQTSGNITYTYTNSKL